MKRSVRRDRSEDGFSLVSTIFIVVVVSLLGISMVQLVGEQRRNSTYSVLEVRAYYAAVAGLEWAIKEISDDPTVCPSGAPFALTEGAFVGYTVTVGCSVTGHWEGGVSPGGGGNEFHVFVLQSRAARGAFGGADFVARTAEATITFPVP